MRNFWAYSLPSPKYTPIPSLKPPVITTMSTTTASYDRLKEIKEFDDSKIGVKGLLDSGITSIPKFFHHPPSTLPQLLRQRQPSHNITIPVIDLSGPHSSVVSQLHHSSSTLGFFQLINHGIPPSTIDRLLSAVQSFNEQPASVKSKHYHREMGKGASFSTNFDLFQSKAASWRDTLQVRLSPGPLDWDQVPEIVREAVGEWEKEVVRVGEELLGLLGEGLGLRRERLEEDMACLGGRTLVAHYYPYCPQSDLTVGITEHTDPGVLTLLVQNQVKGLQVKCGDGEWVDVDPVPGALVVNIGDILQILSNDEYKSVQHRVVANSLQEPRVSVAVFFNPGNRETMYGPLPEMISPHKPPLYRHFLLTDFFKRFFTKELDGKTLTNFYTL